MPICLEAPHAASEHHSNLLSACKLGLVLLSSHVHVTVRRQRPDTQPKPSADQPSDACARQTKEDRTHLVWMPAGGIPSITCTSPTPPPPARRVRRCHPSFTRAHDAPGLLGRKRSHHSPHPTNRNTDSERDPGVESVSEKEDDDARVPEQMADHSLDAADPSG